MSFFSPPFKARQQDQMKKLYTYAYKHFILYSQLIQFRLLVMCYKKAFMR